MVARIEQRVIDFGLNELDTVATDITICATEPTTYAQANATSGYYLGRKAFAAGGAFASPTDESNGRSVSSTAISDGTINGSTAGTASWWAVISTTTSSLYAVGALSAPQAVTLTNTFSLGSFKITIPAHA